MSVCYTLTKRNYIGENALDDALDIVKLRAYGKALIVTDEGLVKIGLVDHLKEHLDKHGIEHVVYAKVQPNPTMDQVHEGLEVYRQENCSFIIAFGGGSAMDCAKGINVLTVNEGRIIDYKVGGKVIQGPLSPFVCITTTAGTASEVTSFAVITDTSTKTKFIVIDELIMADITVVDPHIMKNLPPFITACTGMDALTHAVEAFVATGSNPATDCNAMGAIDLIFKHLPEACQPEHEIECREFMAYAQFMAGIAFNTAGLGIVHAMAHQIGGTHNLAHGLCNAVILPYVVEYNALHSEEARAKYAFIAREMFFVGPHERGTKAAMALVENIKKLSRQVGIPENFKEYNFTKEDAQIWTDKAFEDPCMPFNPVKPSREDILNLYLSLI